MNRTRLHPACFFVCLLAVTAAHADENPAKTGADGRAATQKNQESLIYRPPRRGAPATRIGGGTRGPGSKAPVLQVLAPEHTGLTEQAQPDLYWFVSAPVAARFEFALISDDTLETVTETRLPTVRRAGIQRLSLKDHGVRLKSGVVYQWSVALVADSEQRSLDIVAGGTIERIPSSTRVAKNCTENCAELKTRIYAGNGLWYEAVSTVSDAIRQTPGDRNYRLIRAALLEQVGLDEAAAFERRVNP